MATRIQVVFDCADPDVLMGFWADALGYKPMEPPAGFESWLLYWRSIGVPEDELEGATAVHLVDPDGVGPRVYFQVVPEPNRSIGTPSGSIIFIVMSSGCWAASASSSANM